MDDSPPANGPESRSEPRLPHFPMRLVYIFTSPGRIFEALRHQSGWGLGALAVGAFLGALGYFLPGLLAMDVMEAAFISQMIEAGQDVPDETGTMVTVIWLGGTVGALLGWIVMAAISAGIYSLVYLFFFGYEGSFRQLLAITANALLVAAVGTLLLVPLRIATGDLELTLSVATFLPFLEDGFFATFLRLLDLFNLWCYVLIGMGAALMDGRKSVAHGVSISLGLSILITIVMASILNAF